MWSPITILLISAFLGGAQTGQPPAIDVVTRAGATAAVTSNAEKVLVTITNPMGIGAATIERKGSRWPALRVRLSLRGLESVKLTAGGVTLNGAVSSLREGGQRLSVSTTEKTESPVERSSVYWMDIRVFDERGQATTSLPPQGGWFEFEVPAALLKDDIKTVTLEWIDFYR